MARFDLERVNGVWFLSLGVTAIAAGILIYILLLESVLGAFSIREANPFRLADQQVARVAILESDYTRNAIRRISPEANTAVVDTAVTLWSRYLSDRAVDVRYDVIGDNVLESGELEDYDFIVLPSVTALSDAQISRIRQFMDRGGNILATWTTGIYRPNGDWRGWGFMEDLFGVRFEGFVARGRGGNYRIRRDTFPGFTPEGIYYPRRYFNDDALADSLGLTSNTGFDANRNARLQRMDRMQREAADYNFGPLRGYRWAEDLDPNRRPPADFATADTLMANLRGLDGRMARQRAVAVTYYTWVGSATEDAIRPYPVTGSGIRRVTLRGNTPVTGGIPPGYRAKVQIYNQAVKVRVVEDRTYAAGFWYDFATETGLVEDEVATSAGIVYGNYGPGRFIYMGFERDAIGFDANDDEDNEQLSRLVANVVNYLRRQPVAWVNDWPFDPARVHRPAAILAGIGDGNEANFDAVGQMLRQEGVDGSFFVRPDLMGGLESVMERLHSTGDVGVLDDLMYNRDGSIDEQAARLTRLKDVLESMVNVEADGPVVGYRPNRPGQLGRPSNSNTMSALVRSDYTYFLPDSIGRRLAPKIMGQPFETLTRFSFSARGDKDILTDGISDPGGALFSEDIFRTSYEGSLYVLPYSSSLMASPNNISALRSVVQQLKSQHFYIENGADMEEWWRIRQTLQVDVERRGNARVTVRLTNGHSEVVEDVAVSVALPRPVGKVELRTELIGTDVPEAYYAENRNVVVLHFEQLDPQDSRVFQLDLIDPVSDRPIYAGN
ncbi:MAG: beta-galactosidase trimerization domain-containing protein [Bacteroidota bacterium]